MVQDIFKPIKAKNGYTDLKEIGFYCYSSDKSRDHHKNNKIKGIILKCNYKDYDLYYNDEYIKSFDSNNIDLKEIKKAIKGVC